MPQPESEEIIYTAERRFVGQLRFEHTVTAQIAETSKGYPYFVQLFQEKSS